MTPPDSARRKERRIAKVRRSQQLLEELMAKDKRRAERAERAETRGGARPGAGRKPVFADSDQQGYSVDPVTRARIAAQGEGEGSAFLRVALVNLLADLGRDDDLPAQIAARMERDDPAAWPQNQAAKASPVFMTGPAALAAQVKAWCGRGRPFRSASQFARVAVTRELARRQAAG